MIERSIEEKLRQMTTKFPVVTLTGTRQCGKSTLLRQRFNDFKYISLEDVDHRQFALEDPRGSDHQGRPPQPDRHLGLWIPGQAGDRWIGDQAQAGFLPRRRGTGGPGRRHRGGSWRIRRTNDGEIVGISLSLPHSSTKEHTDAGRAGMLG